MLQRILSLDDGVLVADYSLPTLKVVASSGSALPGELALTWMDRFGDNLYNIYGSTEVAWASIATPEDLRAAPSRPASRRTTPSCASSTRPTSRCPTGATGRIFVGNSLLFEGYTGGGSKDMIDGLMSSGDVGRFDEDGRLYVEGRDDEMIVSGGENVFPQEIEDCLVGHASVVEAAAIGHRRREFGQRLRAFVSVRGESPRTSSRSTSGPTWRATRCPARSSSSPSCPATPPARSSSASWRWTSGRGVTRACSSAGWRPTSRCATSSARTSP